MNKQIMLSVAFLMSFISVPFMDATIFDDAFNDEPVEKNERTVTIGEEFEIMLSALSDRFHDEWHFSSVDLLNEDGENKMIGLELISENYYREFIEPVDDFFKTTNSNLVCKFRATKPGSYAITFTTGKVIACSYFSEKLHFIVHVNQD